MAKSIKDLTHADIEGIPPANPLAELDADEALQNRKQRRRFIGLIVLSVCILILGAILSHHMSRKENPHGLVAYTVGSPVMNLAGPLFEALGQLEGPYVVLEVSDSCRVVMGSQAKPAELFELIGLCHASDLLPVETAGFGADEAARKVAFDEVENYKRAAIQEACGTKSHFILRMSAATPEHPSQIYLIQPVSGTSTSGDYKRPSGQGTLINALLLRQGKANMRVVAPYQPMFAQMMDCHLAAYLEAKKARSTQRKLDSLWTRYSFAFPMNDQLREKAAAIERTIH